MDLAVMDYLGWWNHDGYREEDHHNVSQDRISVIDLDEHFVRRPGVAASSPSMLG